MTLRVLAWVLAFALLPSAGYSQTDSSVDSNPKVQQRLQELEAINKDLLRKMQYLDNRVRTLEAERQEPETEEIAAAPPQQALPAPQPLPRPQTQPPLQTVVAANPVKIFGAAKLDLFYNTARPQAPGVPFFMGPSFVGGFPQNTVDINARQSQLGVAFIGPRIGNWQSGGRISAVFFDPSILTDRNGFLLQQSYGELFNDDWRFAAGLQLDVFAPGLPTVLPFSGLGGSGSAGNSIKGQARLERFVSVGSESQLTLQGALSEPLNTVEFPDTSLDEDNGLPNVEGRIAFGLGKPAPIGIGLLTQRPVEVGVSGVAGQLRRTLFPPEERRVVSDVWGAAVDYRVNLTDFLGFKGEVYTGQALGNYNGGILQALDAVTFEAIRAKGGWVEGFVYLTPHLHSHTGIGVDTANPDDITAVPFSLFGRTFNSTLWSNLIWDIDKTHRVAFEATYRKTEYKELTDTACGGFPCPPNATNLPTEAFGFQTQFAWFF